MKKEFFILLIALSITVLSQGNQPINYGNNSTLSLIGKPLSVREYYYDRLSQIRAHYYTHHFIYHSSGKILQHTKSNIGLYDTILPLFQNIVPPVGVTQYSFAYDSENRLVHYSNLFKGTAGDSTRIDEDWTFDSYGMVTKSYIWEWIPESGKTIKNPSYDRTISRDADNKVTKIEKNAFSFSSNSLVPSEIISYKYDQSNKLDTLVFFQSDDNGQVIFKEKWYDLTFTNYDVLNTDSLLLASYTLEDASASVFTVSQAYDTLLRQTFYHKKDVHEMTILKRDWDYTDTSRIITIEYLDGSNLLGYRYQSIYDAYGYLKSEESFTRDGEEWYSEGPPLEIYERTYDQGKIIEATTLLNDQDRNFYRLKADFEYVYDGVTSVGSKEISNLSITLYPNPCKGILHIEDLDQITEIHLIFANGAQLLLPLQKSINLEVPNGLYAVTLRDKEHTLHRVKLVVE